MWSWVGPMKVAPRSVISPPAKWRVVGPPADAVAGLEDEHRLARLLQLSAAVSPANPAPTTTTSRVALARPFPFVSCFRVGTRDARKGRGSGRRGAGSDQPAPGEPLVRLVGPRVQSRAGFCQRSARGAAAVDAMPR